MGDSQHDHLRVDSDRGIQLEFHGSTVTSDAGRLAYRELGDALGRTATAARGRLDARTGRSTPHDRDALLRPSICSRLAGSEDVSDAERRPVDPAMRPAVGGRANDAAAASTRQMARFGTEALGTRESLKHLSDVLGRWIDQARRHRTPTTPLLDMDSAVRPTDGRQQGSAYNGHFACSGYHPLVLFNPFGDVERAMLRRGHHARAKFRRRVLMPGIDRDRGRDLPKFCRGGPAFAFPKPFALPEREGFGYAIRLKSTAVLERTIARRMTRPVGRPSHKPTVFYHNVRYRAGASDQARRVVVKIAGHAGELSPRVGLVVTDLKWRARRVVRFYNPRGTAEQWLKEGTRAVTGTTLSCRRLRDNAARLQVFALAYNLANVLRRLVRPNPVRSWTRTPLRDKVVQIGAQVVRHSKYVISPLAEVAVPRERFAAVLTRIGRLRRACDTG